MPIPETASDELTRMISEIEEADDVTAASQDLAHRFPPPDRADDLRELTFTGIGQGRGLFGSSDVWLTKTSSDVAGEFLGRQHDAPGWSIPEPGATRRAGIELGNDRRLDYSLRTSRASESSP